MAQRGKKGADEGRDEESDEQSPRPESPTERPVPSKSGLLYYVVGVDPSTGMPVRIEKMEEESGKRTELSQQEYANAFVYASYSAPYYAAQASSFYDPASNPAVQYYLMYLKSLSDYMESTLSPK